jgi:hypothetical protein
MSTLARRRYGNFGRIEGASRAATGGVALICCLLLYRAPPGPLGTACLLAAACALALLTHSAWRGKASTRIAGFAIAVVVLCLGTAAADDQLWRSGLLQYRSVVVLLLGIALLQRVIRNSGLEEPIRALLLHTKSSRTGWVVMALAILMALPLSLATVAILSSILARILREPRDGARLSMRVVSLTMFLVPTTVASAAVNASIPGLHLPQVLLLGLPVFAFGLLATSLSRLQVVQGDEGSTDTSWIKFLGAVFVLIFVAALACGAAISEAVGLTGLGVFICDIVRRKEGISGLANHSADAVRGCSSEVILMFACGLLACALTQFGSGNALVAELVRYCWSSRSLAYLIILFVLPLITIAGIHPLILFNLVFPVVDNALIGTPAAQYIAWVSMFVSAQLLSPVSISAILAAGALRTSPAKTSYQLHYRFVLALTAFTWTVLTLSEGGQLLDRIDQSVGTSMERSK